jgi:hypothetical protein
MSAFWKRIESTSGLPQLGTDESECLDFKEKPWGANQSETIELARDVAQFANQLGGSLIVGAEEESDRLKGYADVSERAQLQTRIADVCHSNRRVLRA